MCITAYLHTHVTAIWIAGLSRLQSKLRKSHQTQSSEQKYHNLVTRENQISHNTGMWELIVKNLTSGPAVFDDVSLVPLKNKQQHHWLLDNDQFRSTRRLYMWGSLWLRSHQELIWWHTPSNQLLHMSQLQMSKQEKSAEFKNDGHHVVQFS